MIEDIYSMCVFENTVSMMKKTIYTSKSLTSYTVIIIFLLKKPCFLYFLVFTIIPQINILLEYKSSCIF